MPENVWSKLKALAAEFVRSDECCVMDTYRDHEETYLEGARAAWTLAQAEIEQLKIEIKYGPSRNRMYETAEENVKLLAEVERLKGEMEFKIQEKNDKLFDSWRTVERELQSAREELERTKIEIESLKKNLGGMEAGEYVVFWHPRDKEPAEEFVKLFKLNEANLTAERARNKELVNALEYIHDNSCSYCSDCPPCGSQHKSIASEALESNSGGGE